MRKIQSISFTRQGAALQQKLTPFFWAQGVEFVSFAKYPVGNCMLWKDSLSTFAEAAFREAEGILFVGAAGIAVRAIAPFLQKKDRDPAVLVLDDTGRYVIPILSGHLGGANDLAKRIGDYLGAEAVITTATDQNGRFSVDSFAVKQNAFIPETHLIKVISAEILKGNPVGFQSDYPVMGKLPLKLIESGKPSVGILISDNREKFPFETTLHLIPRKVVLGVGCRKGVAYDVLRDQVLSVMREQDLTMEQVLMVASIDLKKEESALIRLAKEWKLLFCTFPASRLERLEGSFTPSSFVQKTTGVDNICERAAFLAAEEECARQRTEMPESKEDDAKPPRFLFRKIAGNGVTVAAVEMEWRCRF